MIVLSVDTTGRAGSAAIVDGTVVLAEVSGDPTLTHGQRLPGELMELVNRAGVGLNAVDLLAVAAGPGSFTGLRVGIAAMQGLAMALGKPIVPISTLEALARAGARGPSCYRQPYGASSPHCVAWPRPTRQSSRPVRASRWSARAFYGL